MLSTIARGQTAPFTLSVSVEEVSVTFHAADWHGTSIDDLTANDVRILDNGKHPRQIVSFEVRRSLPVRIGVLIDTSRSVLEDLQQSQEIALHYLNRLFDASRDRGFVMRFDSEAKLVQNWTSDLPPLRDGIRHVAQDHESRMGGTALYDAVYRACRDEFRTTHEVEAGNFILLFTDGSDNASHSQLEDVVQMCQSANTAIYAFYSEFNSFRSLGQKTLRELAQKTGGQMFNDSTPERIWSDLQQTDANLRSQYRIVYKPQQLKHDGAFHRLRVDSPTRGAVITTRSGYYDVR